MGKSTTPYVEAKDKLAEELESKTNANKLEFRLDKQTGNELECNTFRPKTYRKKTRKKVQKNLIRTKGMSTSKSMTNDLVRLHVIENELKEKSKVCIQDDDKMQSKMDDKKRRQSTGQIIRQSKNADYRPVNQSELTKSLNDSLFKSDKKQTINGHAGKFYFFLLYNRIIIYKINALFTLF